MSRMSRHAILVGLTLLGLALPHPLAGQEWKEVTQMRQFAGEDRLRVEVEYGAGQLNVQPGTGKTLYRAKLRYDAELFRPVTSFQGGLLKLGLNGDMKLKKGVRNQNGARLDLDLGTQVPMDLDLKFGAVEADVELGGVKLRSLAIGTGASETRINFSERNTERCSLVKIEAGAASLKVHGLGNANAERLDFDGGVGEIVLDFSGDWRGDMSADIDMGVGSLTLRLPRGLGVRIIKDTFLMSFEPHGLVKRAGAYYSENWERAEHKLTINIDAAFGSIDIDWVDADSGEN